MDPNSIKGNPLVIDKLKPELGGELVKAVADDMERVKREAEEKKKKDKKKRRASK